MEVSKLTIKFKTPEHRSDCNPNPSLNSTLKPSFRRFPGDVYFTTLNLILKFLIFYSSSL